MTYIKNPIESVEEAVLESYDARLIFETLLQGKVHYAARIMLIGMGAVGKSWLYRRCFQNEVIDANTEPRIETPDIDFIHFKPSQNGWQPKIKVGNTTQEVVPTVWDFAGQSVTHGVHETFLNSDGRTVFVLVLSADRVLGSETDDNGKEIGNRLLYWLKTIEHFSGNNVPIVIAITQCDKARDDRKIETEDFEGRLLSQWTPAELNKEFNVWVTDIVDDCSSCDGEISIEPLQGAISDAVAKLTAVREQQVLPEQNELRSYLQEKLRTRTTVPMEEYREWCIDEEVTDLQRQESYRTIFHYSGVQFYFGTAGRTDESREDNLPPGQQRYLEREQDAHLERNLINPHWLKHAIYQITRASKTAVWMSCEKITTKIELEEEADQFKTNGHDLDVVLSFMKRVDLSFYDEDKKAYLFPRGLGPGQPTGSSRWETVSFRWKFFPESYFHRFIVAMHHREYVVKEVGAWQQWRHAVLIEYEGVRAAIVAIPQSGQLEIRYEPTTEESLKEKRLLLETMVKNLFKDDFHLGNPIPVDESSVNETSVDESPAPTFLSFKRWRSGTLAGGVMLVPIYTFWNSLSWPAILGITTTVVAVAFGLYNSLPDRRKEWLLNLFWRID